MLKEILSMEVVWLVTVLNSSDKIMQKTYCEAYTP